MNTKIPDEVYNKNWQALIAEFKSIDHTKKDAKEKYDALKVKTVGVNPLSIRQVSGIIDRCNNGISGEYFINKTFSPNEYTQKRIADGK